MTRPETDAALTVIASILWRCFVVAIIGLIFSFTVYRLMSDQIGRLYSSLSNVNPDDFERIALAAYADVKILSVVAFLFPFLGIKWYLHSQQKAQ